MEPTKRLIVIADTHRIGRVYAKAIAEVRKLDRFPDIISAGGFYRLQGLDPKTVEVFICGPACSRRDTIAAVEYVRLTLGWQYHRYYDIQQVYGLPRPPRIMAK